MNRAERYIDLQMVVVSVCHDRLIRCHSEMVFFVFFFPLFFLKYEETVLCVHEVAHSSTPFTWHWQHFYIDGCNTITHHYRELYVFLSDFSLSFSSSHTFSRRMISAATAVFLYLYACCVLSCMSMSVYALHADCFMAEVTHLQCQIHFLI